jgi:ArsR family transcriptional regulator
MKKTGLIHPYIRIENANRDHRGAMKDTAMEMTTELFKALAHDTRLRILCLLLDGEVCVCQIMAILQLPQSTASRHLAVLKNAGLLEDRRDGVWIYYSLAGQTQPLVEQVMGALRSHLPTLGTCLEDRQRLTSRCSPCD